MWFLGLLLILFIIFIAVPLLRIGLALYRLKRRASEMFGGQAGARREYYGGEDRGPQPAPGKKKKIDPGVGEYVTFEEIPGASADTGKDVEFTPESQIEDATWEYIR